MLLDSGSEAIAPRFGGSTDTLAASAQASNATGGCDSLFGRKCCSSRCNGIRDGSHKDSGVENLELYECIVTEGASGKPMPSYGAYEA